MTDRFEHVFFEIAGIKYYDYIAHVSNVGNWYLSSAKPDMTVFSSGVHKSLHEENIDKYLDLTKTPNDGDALHIVPDCVYAIADIRNNYQIKRGFDAGQYNVFSPLKAQGRCFYIQTIVVIPKLKECVLFNKQFDSAAAARQEVKVMVPNALDGDMLIYKQNENFLYSNTFTNYIPLLLGNAKKPCISYKALNFNTNDLTTDVLMFVYKAGLKDMYDNASEENFVLQLSILNQHNWREYPRTIWWLFNVMLRRAPVNRSVLYHKSKYPKHVKEIYDLASGNKDYKSEKDFNMARDFISLVLNLKQECTFVSTNALTSKLNENYISITQLTELFNTVTRIVPKKYEGL